LFWDEQAALPIIEYLQLKPIDIGAIADKKSATPNTKTVTGILTPLARPNYPKK